MDIDESTHSSWQSVKYTEGGKIKEVWTVPQAVSTARAMMGFADDLLETVVKRIIESDEDAAEQKEEERRTNNDLENG